MFPINPLTAAKAGDFLRKHWPAFAIVGLLAVCLLLAFCMGGSREREKQDQRTIKTERKVGKANETAAGARVEDTVRVEREKQELRDALSNATSGDDARRRAGCVILRQQDRNVADIPACR